MAQNVIGQAFSPEMLALLQRQQEGADDRNLRAAIAEREIMAKLKDVESRNRIANQGAQLEQNKTRYMGALQKEEDQMRMLLENQKQQEGRSQFDRQLELDARKADQSLLGQMALAEKRDLEAELLRRTMESRTQQEETKAAKGQEELKDFIATRDARYQNLLGDGMLKEESVQKLRAQTRAIDASVKNEKKRLRLAEAAEQAERVQDGAYNANKRIEAISRILTELNSVDDFTGQRLADRPDTDPVKAMFMNQIVALRDLLVEDENLDAAQKERLNKILGEQVVYHRPGEYASSAVVNDIGLKLSAANAEVKAQVDAIEKMMNRANPEDTTKPKSAGIK